MSVDVGQRCGATVPTRFATDYNGWMWRPLFIVVWVLAAFVSLPQPGFVQGLGSPDVVAAEAADAHAQMSHRADAAGCDDHAGGVPAHATCCPGCAVPVSVWSLPRLSLIEAPALGHPDRPWRDVIDPIFKPPKRSV